MASNIDPDTVLEISLDLEQALLKDRDFFFAIKEGNLKEACARASVILQSMLED